MPAAGVLIVWTDVAPAIADAFNHWYNHQHLPDRVGRMPGFLRGRRYVAVDAPADAPRFLTLYDLQDTAVMMSDAHVALRRRRSERDRYFVPQFRNTIKGICDVLCRGGRQEPGESDHLVLLPVVAASGHEATFARGMCEVVLPDLCALQGVNSACMAVRNAAVTQASSAKDDRTGDRYENGLVVIEAASDTAAAAAASRLSAERLAQYGGSTQYLSAPCVLRLMFALDAGT
jgi:hypothetical protein